ncbi:NEP1-interacting protein 2-like protein [Drosera capensis]
MDVDLMCRNVICVGMGEFGVGLLKRAGFVAETCVFALGGALIGGIAGAMKGQTTETGICRGAGIGVLSGAIVALELLDSITNGHFLSKVALFGSIVNGKAFMEWASPAVLKAYLWQHMREWFLHGSDRKLTSRLEVGAGPAGSGEWRKGEDSPAMPTLVSLELYRSMACEMRFVPRLQATVRTRRIENQMYRDEQFRWNRERAYDDSRLARGEDIFIENQGVVQK